MVGRLVKNEHVGFGDEDIGKSDALLLSAAQLSHALFKVGYFQLCKNLFRFQDHFRFAVMVEACVENRFVGVELWSLLQKPDTEVFPVDYASGFIAFLAGKDGKQGGLSRTVLCYKSYMLPFGNGE